MSRGDRSSGPLVFFDLVTHFGGAQRSTTLLCGQLREARKVVALDAYGCCRPYIDAFRQQRVEYWALLPQARRTFIGEHGRPLRRLGQMLAHLPRLWALRCELRAALRGLRPAAVWTNTGPGLGVLACAARSLRIPVAFYARGWYRRSHTPAYIRWLVQHRADGVLAISSAAARAIQSWGVPAERIHVVYNTLDIDAIMAERHASLRDTLPGSDRDFRILLPAGLLRAKGHLTAIAAADDLRRTGLSFVLWLAGDSAPGDVSGDAAAIARDIERRNLGNHVFMLGWRADVRALMHHSDAVILPSHTEGLGRVVAEAMVLGKPVVATSVGGIPELLQDGHTGLLVPVQDASSLSTALQRLAADEDMRVRLGQAAAAYVRKRLAPEEHRRRVLAAFDAVSKSRGAPQGRAASSRS